MVDRTVAYELIQAGHTTNAISMNSPLNSTEPFEIVLRRRGGHIAISIDFEWRVAGGKEYGTMLFKSEEFFVGGKSTRSVAPNGFTGKEMQGVIRLLLMVFLTSLIL